MSLSQSLLDGYTAPSAYFLVPEVKILRRRKFSASHMLHAPCIEPSPTPTRKLNVCSVVVRKSQRRRTSQLKTILKTWVSACARRRSFATLVFLHRFCRSSTDFRNYPRDAEWGWTELEALKSTIRYDMYTRLARLEAGFLSPTLYASVPAPAMFRYSSRLCFS